MDVAKRVNESSEDTERAELKMTDRQQISSAVGPVAMTASSPSSRAQNGGTREPTVSMLVVRGLVEIAAQAGAVPQQLLRAAQLDPAQLDSTDARVPRSKVYRLCELALDLTGDPALGLHWAERVGEGSFVPVSHVMAHSATLRQAFDALTQFHRLLSDREIFQLSELHDKVTVRVLLLSGESLAIQRFSAEMIVTGFFRMLRHSSLHPRADVVSFEYAAPSYQHEYLRIFQGTVLFQQPFTGIVFDRALLDAPALRTDDEVHEALEALAERRLQRMTQRTPYAVQVRDFLVRERGGQRTEMEAAARALHLSERSLRRRLAAEGRSYGDIANEALVVVAKHLLRDKQRSIQETAFELGFASLSAFHRAFRRLTGTTPSSFRDALFADGARG